MRELITKKKVETECGAAELCSSSLNTKHIVSCCRKVTAEINVRHDTVVNILLDNIIVWRGLISHELEWGKEDGADLK